MVAIFLRHLHTEFMSQLVRYARACCKYQEFVDRGKLLTKKLLSQGYRNMKLVSTVKKFHGRHRELVDPCNDAISKCISDFIASVEVGKAFKYRIFIFTNLLHGYIDMA